MFLTGGIVFTHGALGGPLCGRVAGALSVGDSLGVCSSRRSSELIACFSDYRDGTARQTLERRSQQDQNRVIPARCGRFGSAGFLESGDQKVGSASVISCWQIISFD